MDSLEVLASFIRVSIYINNELKYYFCNLFKIPGMKPQYK